MLQDAMPAFFAEEMLLVDVFGESFQEEFDQLGVRTIGELMECPEIPMRLDMELVDALCG